MKTAGLIVATLSTALGFYLAVVIVRAVAPDVRRYLRIRAM